MSETGESGYQVLARKYRPQSFADLVGQDAIVRTLKNAFAADRIAQAFILTGIRGTGKTTTARIIAKGMNCIGADGQGGPTTEPCGKCEHCVAIAEGRHVDVLEMDAASNTGSTTSATRCWTRSPMRPPRRDSRSISSTRFTCFRRAPSTRF